METACPSCSHVYQVPDAAAGKKARCKKCDHTFKVEPFVELDLEEDNDPPANAPEPRLRSFYITFGLAILGGIIIGIWSFDDSPKKHSHSPDDAYVMAQNFVEDRLRSPSTADFPSSSQARITHLGGGSYRVAAWVDSQNGFGAMVRTKFTCELHTNDGNRWICDELTFNR